VPHEPAPHLAELLHFGGFPEPFHAQSEAEHRRWSNARSQLLIREDLREISQVSLIGLVEQLMMLLPERIGSLFSFNSLAEDIRVSPVTIKKWMEMFQRLFIVFPVPPYSQKIARALHRQPKFFLNDWSQTPDAGDRFENMIACHLWKAVQTWTDLGLANLALHHIRDRDGRECDFLITRDRKPWFLVEAKLTETRPSPALEYFSRRLSVPGIQMVSSEGVCRQSGNILVVSANRWLGRLP
jgi:predicted AAA+ superfamily ATPase